MKSSALLISVLIFILSSVLQASEYPRHYVFLVHGIAAGPSTFGQMSAALAREAVTLDPHTDWQFINFAYETGNHNKDVKIFSQELSEFIATKFKSAGGLKPDDKFSLVMHSQGGLIGFNFLINSFMNNAKFHPELQSHLDAFVTLGTPYWGAKIAIFANRMLPVLSYLRIPLSDKFGEEELRDMSLASDFGAEMRESMMNSAYQDVLEKIKLQARILAFSGVTERLNILAPFVTGKNRYEDDTAVPIPTSRLDFIYYSDSADKHNASVGIEEFSETNMINKENYIVVNTFHTSPFPQNAKFPGIAKVPDRCLNISYRDCDHPTYPMLVEHLFKLQREPAFVRALTSFAIDFKINTQGAVFERKKLLISFKSISTGLNIDKDVELYNNVGRWTDKGDYRLYHTGYIDPKKTSSTLGKVQVTISAPGFVERTLLIPVKTALSTFVEIDLEKK
ncbi:MAG: hypothetical protein H7281_12525 [Bacteriovorax sp.]|nr:hypothetical protein [Bacteriovorax sp.]